MPALTRPGVYVDESAFPTYASRSPGTAAACFVGTCPRGPLTPTFVTSWRDFTSWYGGFETAYPPSALHLAAFSYFSAGGTTATMIRVVRTDGSGPVVATHKLNDQATTPAPCLQIDAANPGIWGNNVYIDILDGTVPDPMNPGKFLTFTIQVKYQGTNQNNVVESFRDLTMVPGSANFGQNNYALDVVNSPYTGSRFIHLEDLVTTVPPTAANNPPHTSASQQLSGGADGSTETAQDYQTAVEQLDAYPDQPFVLNVPGVPVDGGTGSSILGPVITYAQNRGDTFLVLDPPVNTPPSAMAGFASSLSSTAQAAIYYPLVQISDPYSINVGVTRLIPPGGFVTGVIIDTDLTRGVQKAPAGLGAALQGVTGLERTLTNIDQGILTQANVNCLISVPGSGVVIWGARTLSPYLVTRYVPVQRSLIYLQTQLVALTKYAVFEPNDWKLWNSLVSVCGQFLDQFWQSGGLRGQSGGEAYYVTCDSTINTPQTIQQGIVNVEVGVALQYPAEFVVISIGQWAGGSSVSTSTL